MLIYIHIINNYQFKYVVIMYIVSTDVIVLNSLAQMTKHNRFCLHRIIL